MLQLHRPKRTLCSKKDAPDIVMEGQTLMFFVSVANKVAITTLSPLVVGYYYTHQV